MKKVLINLGLILLIGGLISVLFFHVFLPGYTNHGEIVIVPDLAGLKQQEVEKLLSQRKLQYVIEEDSGYNKTLPAQVVLKQEPASGSEVKENRKIYLTLNAKVAPKVIMPQLVGESLESAKALMKAKNFEIGTIKTKPYFADNIVLEQRINGRSVRNGESVIVGSRVDLVVGKNEGQLVDVPDLIGMELNDARAIISKHNLVFGGVISEEGEGVVTKQSPKAGTKIREGSMVDVWLSGVSYDSN